MLRYECVDGYRVNGEASGNASFDVKCGADGKSIQLGSCSPVSCGQPTSMSNSFVDIREYVFPENASYICDSGYTTTGVPSGVTSFTKASQANGNFTTGHECQAVSCDVPEDDGGTRSPHGNISFPDSATVTCEEGYTTDPAGNVRGATSYSMTCTTSGNLSFSSEGCGLFDSLEIYHCVSDVSTCTGNVCCVGYSGSSDETFHAETQNTILLDVTQASITICTIPPS